MSAHEARSRAPGETKTEDTMAEKTKLKKAWKMKANPDPGHESLS